MIMAYLDVWGRRSDELSDDTEHNRFILVFILIQLIGCGGLAIIFLTAVFSRQVKRHSTWYSFIGSWVFSCACYCILFFAGQQVGDPPILSLCMVQAALIYAAPCLTACTTLSLVIHMFLNFRSLLNTSNLKVSLMTQMLLLGTPYIVWLVAFIAILAFELHHSTTVRRSPKGTYCDSSLPIFSRISSSIVAVATLSIVVLLSERILPASGVILSQRIMKNRRAYMNERQMRFAMLFRVLAFSVIGTIALGLAVAFIISKNHDIAFDMVLASLPVLAIPIFGSQMDLVRVWTCRPSEREYTTENMPKRAIELDRLKFVSLSSNGTTTTTTSSTTSPLYATEIFPK